MIESSYCSPQYLLLQQTHKHIQKQWHGHPRTEHEKKNDVKSIHYNSILTLNFGI